MGTITAIIIAILSIITDPTGRGLTTNNTSTNNVIITDPTGVTSNNSTGTVQNVIITDPTGKM